MFNYEFYKVLHLICLVSVVALIAINTALEKPQKWVKISAMTASFFLFVAGMGLLARAGFPHGEPWPVWVKIKIVLWLILAIGTPMLMKRFPTKRPNVFIGFISIIIIAILLVIYRPFA